MHPNSLADILIPLSRFFPETLRDSETGKWSIQLAGYLPALLCPYTFGYEMPLDVPLKDVDFAFCITQPGCDILAGKFPDDSSLPFLQDSKIWPALKRFCRVWGDPSTDLQNRIINLWLEFFLQKKNFHLYPVPFIKIRNNTESLVWLPDVLGLLYGKKLSPGVGKQVSLCLGKLPTGIYPFQAGIYDKGGECRVRLCLKGVTAENISALLRIIGYIDFDCFASYAELLTITDRLCLHIDVGDRIGNTLGIELRQKHEHELCVHTQADWGKVLDVLVKKNLCLPVNSLFLKHFPGSSYEMIPPDFTQFITHRFLYYVKAVYHPDQRLRVKAYFGFVNRTHVPELKKIKTFSFFSHTVLSQSLVSNAIKRGAAFLRQNQLPDGEFKTYLGRDRQLETAEYDSSPFVTSFVLFCTQHLPDAIFGLAKQKAKHFLLREGYPGFLWKYWTRTSNKTIKPDTDDTSCISFILKTLFRLDQVKENIPVLLAHRDKNGLFKTWIKEADEPNDVDIVVNANVLLYLGEREETQAAIDFIKYCIKAGKEQSHNWYYPDDSACYYMVARAAYYGISALKELFPIIEEHILNRLIKTGECENELTTALSVAALYYMGVPCNAFQKSLLRLLNRQQANGCWERIAFYAGPEPPVRHSVWFGSEELTTGFCISALNSFLYEQTGK